MPRHARVRIAKCPWHVIQRGVNRSPCFLDDADRRLYLNLLRAYSRRHACAVHAYVLMTNHVHLLVSPEDEDGLSKMMKALGERYVPYFNRLHGRTGTLWEGRFRSSVVQSERYLMICQRYIELNPVRAGIVARAGDLPWSSYAANAMGVPSDLVTPHELYLRLGPDRYERAKAYRRALRAALRYGHQAHPRINERRQRVGNRRVREGAGVANGNPGVAAEARTATRIRDSK